jgi:glycosyltransferase involved in cell wall biosynthesis
MIDFSFTEWIVTGCLLLFFTVQVLFYILLYRLPYVYEKKRKEKPVSDDIFPPVSIIIVSKNDGDELERNLPFILEQDYPNFEVIVVNSRSTDETDIVLKATELKYNNFYHTYVPKSSETVHERKLALTLGIKAAKNDILLFTEAYCRPCSSQWIKEFASVFNSGKEVVLGYCKLVVDKKAAFRGFIRYDNLIHYLKFLSMTIAHKPFMGIGWNMAYRKELFVNQKGFSPILNVSEGEDNLFINTIANEKNTGVVISPESMTETSIVNRLSVWRAMKSKYLHTRQFYKNSSWRILSWETFSKYAFYAALTCAIMLGVVYSNYILLGFATLLFIIRFGIQLSVVNKNARLFDAGRFYFSLPFLDFWQPISNFRFRRKQKIRRI